MVRYQILVKATEAHHVYQATDPRSIRVVDIWAHTLSEYSAVVTCDEGALVDWFSAPVNGRAGYGFPVGTLLLYSKLDPFQVIKRRAK